MARFDSLRLRQSGMVLLICLVFLLMSSLIGVAAMQGAVSQQKNVGGLRHRHQSFQAAESGLRLGESIVRRTPDVIPVCASISACAPPVESTSLVVGGTNPVSAVTWITLKGGLYGVQSLGVVDLPPAPPSALYRVTAVGISGQTRTVLETVYAREGAPGKVRYQRVLWRQIQ